MCLTSLGSTTSGRKGQNGICQNQDIEVRQPFGLGNVTINPQAASFKATELSDRYTEGDSVQPSTDAPYGVGGREY